MKISKEKFKKLNLKIYLIILELHGCKLEAKKVVLFAIFLTTPFEYNYTKIAEVNSFYK